MYYVTQNFVWTRAALNLMLTALKTNPAAAIFPALKMRLGKDAGFQIGPDTTLAAANAQVCDFTDYAEAAITLSDPLSINADCVGDLASAQFTITTSPVVTGNNVANYYLYFGTTLVGGEKFAGGVTFPMAATGDYLQIDGILPQLFAQSLA